MPRNGNARCHRFPRGWGWLRSETGAVIHDIRTVIARRYPVEIVISPTAVQGDEAHKEIAWAIRRVAGLVDVVIVARGGGSFEDLFSFNHPDVVRAIAACPVPVVSAIGHEVDVTLADLAADMRAPTPSAAAELVVPDRKDLRIALRDLRAASWAGHCLPASHVRRRISLRFVIGSARSGSVGRSVRNGRQPPISLNGSNGRL